MTKLAKIKLLDEYSIEHTISDRGILLGLWKMSTRAGDDCSQWYEFDEIMEILKEARML